MLECFGSIEVEGDGIKALNEASNAWISCGLPMLCTIYPGIFRAKKLGKICTNHMFTNLSQEPLLTKMTPFGPRALIRWRMHWPYLFWCERQNDEVKHGSTPIFN